MTSSSAWIRVDARAQRRARRRRRRRTGPGRRGCSACRHHRLTVLILLPPSEGKSAPRRGKPLDLADPRLPRPDRRPGAGPRRAGRALRGRPGRRREDPRHRQHPARPGRAQPARCGPRRPRGPTRSTPASCTTPSTSPRSRPAAKRRATARLAVTSSLFGLVRPGDRIPAYRLSGDATLPGLGSVAGVWREHLGAGRHRGGRRRPAGRPAQRHVRRVLAAAAERAGRDGAGAARAPGHSARWSATSTRPPRAGSSARCSRTAPTRARRPSWPTRCATSAGRSRRTPAAGAQLDVVVSEL